MADKCGLIRQARAGDGDAYAALVERRQAVAYRAAFLVTRNAQDAEEATQDGFMKAYRALDRFRTGEPFRPWLLRIVTNAARDRQRAGNRQRALTLKLDQAASGARQHPSPERETLRAERRRAVIAALDEMGDADRELLTYRYFLDLPTAEIAAMLEARESTIRTRLLRARRRLRDRLEAAPQLFEIERDG